MGVDSPRNDNLNAEPTTIKASFREELRRVTLDRVSFVSLSEKVAALFGLDQGSIVLKYNDDDGDKITMSSDAELQEALRLSKSMEKVVRVYVELKGQPQPQPAPFSFAAPSAFPAAKQEEPDLRGDASRRYRPPHFAPPHHGPFSSASPAFAHGVFQPAGAAAPASPFAPPAAVGAAVAPQAAAPPAAPPAAPWSFFGPPHHQGHHHGPEHHGPGHHGHHGHHGSHHPFHHHPFHSRFGPGYTVHRPQPDGVFSFAGDAGDRSQIRQSLKEDRCAFKEQKDAMKQTWKQMKRAASTEEERAALKEMKAEIKQHMRMAKSEFREAKKDKMDAFRAEKKAAKQIRLVARHVEDVTIPDGTELPPNTPFIKTWKLRNEGPAWPTGSQLLFISHKGDNLNGPERVTIKGEVQPGQEVEVSVPLITPPEPGRYVGYYRLVTPAGVKFGQRVWVSFVVKRDADVTMTATTTTATTATSNDVAKVCDDVDL